MGEKYYLILIQNFIDTEQPTAKVLYEYNSLDDARVAYHTELSYAMSGSTILSILATVIDHYGNERNREFWMRTIMPEEPSDEVVEG